MLFHQIPKYFVYIYMIRDYYRFGRTTRYRYEKFIEHLNSVHWYCLIDRIRKPIQFRFTLIALIPPPPPPHRLLSCPSFTSRTYCSMKLSLETFNLKISCTAFALCTFRIFKKVQKDLWQTTVYPPVKWSIAS